MCTLTAEECPAGMAYQQCGSLCPQTCGNVDQRLCNSGCAEGCFCPDGQVLIDGICKHALACPGISSKHFLKIIHLCASIYSNAQIITQGYMHITFIYVCVEKLNIYKTLSLY